MAVNSLTPEMLAEMETLQLRARSLVETVLTGTHRGKQRGFSIDFAEHREYSPGDDVRFLDWKLYGKRDRFYVRQFEDENLLQAWLLLDVSGSMLYRSAEMRLSKLDYAASVCAALAWIACYQGDQAGLLCFDETVYGSKGLHFGTIGANRLIQDLENVLLSVAASKQLSTREDEVWRGLFTAAERVPRSSVVFLLTDAFGEAVPLKRVLTLLHRKKCDVRLLHILDPAELSFPFEGNTLFRDLEGGGDYQATGQSIRVAYLEEFETALKEIRQLAGETNSQYQQVETSAPVDKVLRRILKAGNSS